MPTPPIQIHPDFHPNPNPIPIPSPCNSPIRSLSTNLPLSISTPSSSTPATRPFGDKHDAQIIHILASINPSPTSQSSADLPKTSSLKDEDFHPVLRSQSAHASSSSAHLHPQFLDPPEPASSTQSASAIPTGYGSPSAIGAPNGLAVWPARTSTSWPARLRTPSPSRGRPQTDPADVVWREAGTGSGAEGSLERHSDQWKQHRKNTHKEVERRRRETINEGITELKKIVPGSEKNKGEILKQAVRYIVELKQGAAQAAEQWALEKAVLEQTLGSQGERVGALSRQCGKLEAENESLRRWIVDLGEQGPPRNQAHTEQEQEQDPDSNPQPIASSSLLDKPNPENQDQPNRLAPVPTLNGDTEIHRNNLSCSSKINDHSSLASGDGAGDGKSGERDRGIDKQACKKTKLC